MASKPKKKKLTCKTTCTIFISTEDGQTINCGDKLLKGRSKEFETIWDKIRDKSAKAGIEEKNLKLFWVESDGSEVAIADQDKLQGL